MTKLPFQINTDVTIQDIMNYAEFKLRLARDEEKEETAALLRLQAGELHYICDSIMKSAIGNTTGYNFLGAYEIPNLPMQSMDNKKLLDMVGLTKRALPSFSTAMSDRKYPFNIEEAKLVVESKPGGKEITSPKLPFGDNGEQKELEEVAKLILTKGYGENEADDEWVKMVKETVISSIKQRGGRMEAVRFLTNHAFKSLNWTDTEAHSFINQLKEVEDIVEPKKKPKKDEEVEPF